MRQTGIFKSGISVFLKMLLTIVMSYIVTLSLLLLLSKVATLGFILSFVCCMMIFIAIPYSYIWEIASTDKNKVNYGHESEDMLKGFKIGLIASVPAFLTAVLLLVCTAIAKGEFAHYVFILYNAQFLPLFLKVLPLSMKISEINFGVSLLCSLATFVLPVITGIAYVLGYKRISLIDKFIYKNAPRKRKPKKRR